MDDAALFEATVPVLEHYCERIEALLSSLTEAQAASLQRRLAPRAFRAAEHLDTALGFVPRTLGPLTGREWPEAADGEDAPDRDRLLRSVRSARDLLAATAPADFAGATGRRVRHAAGDAELEQDAVDFATRFALPNFFFHLATAFAILRGEGVEIGKADFDGQHVYAPGFHF